MHGPLYAGYVRSFQFQYTYVQRTCPGDAALYRPLEDTICSLLLPTLTGWGSISHGEREIMALPVRRGGLGIANPVKTAASNFAASKAATAHLVGALHGAHPFSNNAHYLGFTAATCAHKAGQRISHLLRVEELLKGPDLPDGTKRVFERLSKHGAGACLTTRPLAAQGLALSPHEFQDKLATNFSKQPRGVQPHCACGPRVPYTLDHALTCPTGGNRIGRHNAVRDSL